MSQMVNDKKCYNLKTGGMGGSGLRHSEESKAKMSASGKGKQSWLGKSHSEESKAKMSASAKGKLLLQKLESENQCH
jgi:hypothetical protein